MENKLKKTSSSDIPSPILLRRRLSAPETVMRKYSLARTQSQESDFTSSSEAKSYPYDSGSNDNLNKRKDSSVVMRKTTLLRRLMTNSKVSASSTFHEWQHSCGKLSTHSLTSLHSSPEHVSKSQSRRSLTGYEFRTSPQHRRVSPSHKVNEPNRNTASPKRKISVYNGNYGTTMCHNSCCSNCINKAKPKIPKEPEPTSSAVAILSESDSVFSNTRESYSSSNNNSTSSKSAVKLLEDVNKNPKIINEATTQTLGRTNLNIISNVQLSQSTLDLIFNQVIQDVQKKPIANETNEEKVSSSAIKVQQVPSFYLKQKEDPENPILNKIVKYMIGNVDAGSPYKDSNENSSVPRYSALPLTYSMEVNCATPSDGTDIDNNSDTISLVDSLEDTTTKHFKYCDDKLVEVDKSNTKVNKPAMFFIPIEVNNYHENKSVSEHLPSKVREKLVRRQKKLQEKINQCKSNNISPHSATSSTKVQLNSFHNYNKTKRKKPVLPNIEATRKININNDDIKNNRDKPKPNVKPLNKAKNSEKQPNFSTHNEYYYGSVPKRIYHKTEFTNSNKRIEILEIMECVEASSEKSSARSQKGKSKIPVSVSSQTPKLLKSDSSPVEPDKVNHKPRFLDLNHMEENDPKLDQLIANILIETLNEEAQKLEITNANPTEAIKIPSHLKHPQTFEVIPEELSQQSPNDDLHRSNNNNNVETVGLKAIDNNNLVLEKLEKINTNKAPQFYKGRAAVAVVREDDVASIPKGWITFYMLQKNQSSPDSTSDEEHKPGEEKQMNHKTFNNNSLNAEELSKNIEERSIASSRRKPSRVKSKKPNPMGDWSITLTGKHGPVLGQDLEMKVRFNVNKRNDQGQSDSGLGEETISDEKKSLLPRIYDKQYRKKEEEPIAKTNYRIERLPQIDSHLLQKLPKRSESSISSNLSSIMEPRQTRTSTKRYNLARRNVYALPDTSTYDIVERQYQELTRQFPHLLGISGSKIKSDNKNLLTAERNYFGGSGPR